MSVTFESTLLDDLLDSLAACMTPEFARRMATLQASPAVQNRFDQLAGKSNEGQLTPAEADEYDALLRTLDLITMLQLKAQKLLDEESSD